MESCLIQIRQFWGLIHTTRLTLNGAIEVDTHHPELAQEFTHRMTENPESDVELQNKPEKDVPDWHAELFYGFDKKQDAKEEFSDLFYGINTDLFKDFKPSQY